MKKLFRIDDFGAGCFGVIAVVVLATGAAGAVPVALWLFH